LQEQRSKGLVATVVALLRRLLAEAGNG